MRTAGKMSLFIYNKIQQIKQTLKRIREDERGMEPIQVVLILAVAAVVIAVLWSFWESDIWPWFENVMGKVTDIES